MKKSTDEGSMNRSPVGENGVRRKVYTSPRLTRYGGIAKLTQGAGTGGNDQNATGRMLTTCL